MDFIKIAVLNNSGNVGKSTICQTLLSPRIDGAKLIRVETINSDGINEDGLSAKDMTSVIEQIDIADKAIIDVGSSNIENFILGLQRNVGSHEDVDIYLVPTTTEVKQQKDTISTIETLLDMGVNSESISIVFNKADPQTDLERQFSTIVKSGILSKLGKQTIVEYPIIFESEIFNLLEKIKQPYNQVLDDKTDYKAAIRATQCIDERSILSIKRSANRLAKAHDAQLDAEFKKIIA
jgi:hypothetical protein